MACGGQSQNPHMNAAAGGEAGGAGLSGGAGGEASTTMACPPAPPPDPPVVVGGPPASFACAKNLDGAWVETPCSCELWLRNPLASPLQTTVSLDYTPTTEPPSPTSTPNVELKFPDPDASWYAAWSSQPDAGTSFTLMNENGVTSMRLAIGKVTLAPVTLPGCARLTATSSVTGPWGSRLDLVMKATLTDSSGNAVTTSTGECVQPASHPSFDPGAAGSSAGGEPK